ncbi:efflux RND transporter permease subunit [Haloarchaeobius amylolyticus]|uniref:efflux RND transporter permease subunit n=1 Tax=Haloarchaeobius amylolyticus TaxID=1198296 RepID=UPI00227011E6|nr:MMPL family transporter [Haloarchaeobius amylolyticus]
MSQDNLVRRVAGLVVDRPAAVVVAFLVVTAGFATGLPAVSTDAGTEGFTEDLPSTNALEKVEGLFEPPFDPPEGTTQLIQSSQNVLAKPSLLRMLATLERIESDPGFRVKSTSSAASLVAQQLDPDATTPEAQTEAVEGATPAEIARAVDRAGENPAFRALLSDDYNERAGSAGATIAIVTHALPAEPPSAGSGTDDPLTPLQERMQHVVSADIVVFGSGILAAETGTVIADSLLIIVPAASLLILTFLLYAYRDPADLALGVISLAMTIVWTFGFLGLAGIAFTQLLVAVPPLLLAVGIDFGIHVVNRYREERVKGRSPTVSMDIAGRQLLVAFFIVTGTTVIGFAANATSSLKPIADFGITAAIGITFTFLVFGVFLPAAKVLVDTQRDRLGIPAFGQRPLGQEGSRLGAVLPVGVVIARRAPGIFLVLVLLLAGVSANYGAGIDTTFSEDDFLPRTDQPVYITSLPEPFKPGVYTTPETIDFLEENFESAEDDVVIVLVEGPLTEDYALESIQRAGENPPTTLVVDRRDARAESIVTVIRQYAARDPEFAALVARNDLDGNGIPDDGLDQVYDALLDSPVRDTALTYLTDDYRSARIVYRVESDAEQDVVAGDAVTVAERHRLQATATGTIVVFQAVSGLIFETAVESLVIALALTAVFLVFIYRVTLGMGSLGIVNLVPIAVSIAFIAGSMRFLGIPFNALTATVFSVALGLGIDYSAHVIHRVAEELAETGDVFAALENTTRGTGGALTGSMLTTVSGIGVLGLAITPILGQFGLVVALSVFYSYLASIVVTPAAVVVWARLLEAWRAARFGRPARARA